MGCIGQSNVEKRHRLRQAEVARYSADGKQYGARNTSVAALICSGQISREDALLEIAKPPISELQKKQDINFVEKKLNLKSGELNRIINNPSISYEVYPNQERFWKNLRPLISKFRRIITRPE